MRHHLAVISCLVLAGSIANARPRHRHRHHHVAVVEEAVEVEAPLALHSPSHDWHLAVGPYLWASSVDANVSLGNASVASSVDFLQTTQHAKYGAELLGEARYGRFSVSSDFMYGVVGVEGGSSLGPLMVTVNGEASSLLVDGVAGYTLAGDEHSVLAFEARGGVRYQRTAIEGAVGVDGSMVAQPGTIDAGRDAIIGGRVFVRPAAAFYVTGAADVGVYGSSNTTWSAAADASLRLGSRVLLSVGYRTLTIDRAHVSMVMHGPRAALQLLF